MTAPTLSLVCSTATRLSRWLALALSLGVCTAHAAGARDGSHDFDFDTGTWSMHYARLVKPLSGSTEWTHMSGTTVVTPIWGGRGNLAVVDTDGPSGHFELLALRLFDPGAQQWRISFANSRVGILDAVPLVGTFENGLGTFYDQEEFNGRLIWVRFTVGATSATSAHSEQAFSEDAGRTWETNWVTDYEKLH